MQCTHTNVVSTANWQPPHNGRPSATTTNLRLSVASRVITLEVTRPQPLCKCVQLRSPKRTSLHAAQWWPNESVLRPHQHMCKERRGHPGEEGRDLREMRSSSDCQSKTHSWTSLRPKLARVAPFFRRAPAPSSVSSFERRLRAATLGAELLARNRLVLWSSGRAPVTRARHDEGSSPMETISALADAAAAPRNGVSGTSSK